MSGKKYLNSDGLIRLVANFIDYFAHKIHSHTLSEITDYTVDSALSSTSVNPVQNSVINAAIDNVVVSKQDMITGTSGQFVIIGTDGYVDTATIPLAEDGSF